MNESLRQHLASGATSVARAWKITRTDGVVLGFTDHDQKLRFDGQEFRADGGMSALTLSQGGGLSVDNTEALGILSDDAISEADISAGLFDGAWVEAWLVNWADLAERQLLFRGQIAALTREAGSFRAALEGLSAPLNQVQGQVYQSECSARLGDGRCRFDLSQSGYQLEVEIAAISELGHFYFDGLDHFPEGWFSRGRLEVLNGVAVGMSASIKADREEVAPPQDGRRRIDLWGEVRAEVGDRVRLVAGCDKRAPTCREKFNNFLNFRGFPDIPGEDWMGAYPKNGEEYDGGDYRTEAQDAQEQIFGDVDLSLFNPKPAV